MSASFNANQRHLHQLNNHDVKALGIHVSRAFLYTKTIYKMNTLKMMYKGKGERNEQGCRNW